MGRLGAHVVPQAPCVGASCDVVTITIVIAIATHVATATAYVAPAVPALAALPQVRRAVGGCLLRHALAPQRTKQPRERRWPATRAAAHGPQG